MTVSPNPANPIYKMDYAEVPELMGRWRMEVNPGASREQDLFPHVLQLGDRSLQSMVKTDVRETDGEVEVAFDAGTLRTCLWFASRGNVSGRVRLDQNGRTLIDRPLADDAMPQSGLALLP